MNEKRTRRSRLKECNTYDDKNSLITVCIIGGGISGISCAQKLVELSLSVYRVILISESDVMKEAIGVMKVTNYVNEVTVYENSLSHFQLNNPNISIIKGKVVSLDYNSKSLTLQNGQIVEYDKICICTGGIPKLLLPNHPYVIGIRDLESIEHFIQRLHSSTSVIVVGNGGIALELVYALLDEYDIEWIIKDDYIGNAFFDKDASEFLFPKNKDFAESLQVKHDSFSKTKHCHNTFVASNSTHSDVAKHDANESFGSKQNNFSKLNSKDYKYSDKHISFAVGPHWDIKAEFSKYSMLKDLNRRKACKKQLKIHYNQEVIQIYDNLTNRWLTVIEQSEDMKSQIRQTNKPNLDGFNIAVMTSSNTLILGDFLVSAIGINPNSSLFVEKNCSSCAVFNNDEKYNENISNIEDNVPMTNRNTMNKRICSYFKYPIHDNSIVVNESMMTSLKDIYAAGDCCYYSPQISYNISQLGWYKNMQTYKRYNSDKEYLSNLIQNTWFQMRLWDQARSMGTYAAECIHSDIINKDKLEEHIDSSAFLEIFTHVTHFFGYKVVLLGRYNCQGLQLLDEQIQQQFAVTEVNEIITIPKDGEMPCGMKSVMENPNIIIITSKTATISELQLDDTDKYISIWTRVKYGLEYVKLVSHNGYVIGAVIIGDNTDLVETFENLILNRIDISHLGVNVLNPNIDIDDYFD